MSNTSAPQELPIMERQPLSVRRGMRPPFRLIEGIPPYARESLWDRLAASFNSTQQVNLVRAALRIAHWNPSQYQNDVQHLKSLMLGDENLLLDLTDWYLGKRRDTNLQQVIGNWLDDVGSVWMTKDFRLERRVSVESQNAYLDAVSAGTELAEHLSKAWENAFSRFPDPTGAWNAAVKAVELVLQPIVSPNDTKAELTKLRRALIDAPRKWEFLGSTDDSGIQPFIDALSVITYEPGRHGSDPARASIQQARAVVLQAVTVVEWVQQGLLVPASSTI